MFGLRRFVQGAGALLGGGQVVLHGRQALALGLGQQRGFKRGLVGEGAGLQGLLPGLRSGVQRGGLLGLRGVRLGALPVQRGQGFGELVDGLHAGGQGGGHIGVLNVTQRLKVFGPVAPAGLQRGPALRPRVCLGVCRRLLCLLAGDGLGQRLHLRLCALPVSPFGIACGQPRRGVGGQGVTGVAQCGLQGGFERCGLHLRGGDGVQQRGLARLRILGGLLEQGELVVGRLHGLRALVERRLRLLCALLACLGRLQVGAALGQRGGGGVLPGGECVGVLPIVCGGGIADLTDGCCPLRLPLVHQLCGFCVLALAFFQLGFAAFDHGRNRLAVGDQLIQRGLFLLQRGFGGRYVQRLIRRNRRVLDRATQRAGLAGLQGVAVLVQALDAALLRQQFFFVCHLLFERLVLRSQVLPCGLVLGDGCLQRLQLRGQRVVLRGQFAALLAQLGDVCPPADLALRGLPACTQCGQRVATQSVRLFELRSLQRGL